MRKYAHYLLILLSTLLLVWAIFPDRSAAQTTNLNCTEIPINVRNFEYIYVNQANDCLDQGFHNYTTFAFASDANDTMTSAELEAANHFEISGSLTATRTLNLPTTVERLVTFENTTSQSIVLSQGGTTVTLNPGLTARVSLDGTNVRWATDDWQGGTADTTPVSGDRQPYYDVSAFSFGWLDVANFPGGAATITATTSSDTWELLQKEIITAATDEVDWFFDGSEFVELVWVGVGMSVEANTGAILEWVVSTDGSTFVESNSNYEYYRIWDDSGDSTPNRWDINVASTNTEGITNEARVGLRHWGDNADEADSVFIMRCFGSGSGMLFGCWHRSYGTGQAIDSGNSNIQRTEGHGHYRSTTEILGLQTRTSDVAKSVDAGTMWLFGRRAVTASTSAVTHLETTNNTQTDFYTYALASGTMAAVRVTVHGIEAGGETYTAKLYSMCRNNAGTTACDTQDRDEIELGTVSASVDASVIADDTADELTVAVTGATSETWQWTATIELVGGQ